MLVTKCRIMIQIQAVTVICCSSDLCGSSECKFPVESQKSH